MKENQLEQKCSSCHSSDTSEVLETEGNLRQGWLCKKCGKFTKAIGRERVWREDNQVMLGGHE